MWNIKHDTLELNFQEHMLLIQDPPTKLLLIKYFNSLHDSLRLLNLYIVRLKKKSQKVCKVGISWNQTIPQELVCEWNKLFEDTTNCKVFAIKRWNANTAHAHKLELHWLSDSLLKAYGCCVYVKIIILDGPVTTSLVKSKSLAKSHANSNHPKVRTYGHTFINKVNH